MEHVEKEEVVLEEKQEKPRKKTESKKESQVSQSKGKRYFVTFKYNTKIGNIEWSPGKHEVTKKELSLIKTSIPEGTYKQV